MKLVIKGQLRHRVAQSMLFSRLWAQKRGLGSSFSTGGKGATSSAKRPLVVTEALPKAQRGARPPPKRKPQHNAPPPTVISNAKSWKELFQSTSVSQGRETMIYTKPTETLTGEPLVVERNEVDYEDAIHQWVFEATLEAKRRNLMLKGNGFFVVTFDIEEDLQAVLEGGPWTMASQPFVIQRWSPSVKMELERLTSTPIWVKFPNLPLHRWTMDCLSKISSAIPLDRDATTIQGIRVSFARVCIKVEARAVLPDSIVVNSPIAIRKEHKVLYDWKPQACSFCNTFGHDDTMCCKKPSQTKVGEAPSKKQLQVWQEVKTQKSNVEGTIHHKPKEAQEQSFNQFASLQSEEEEVDVN
ncbi:hypothetical protein QJS10_CPA07g00968 [Acorus calamus]|uniref:DUF4283 domain-containing protein n=1 Tax=Acorus calamus TaxID=4465 RepID=A0AAV9EGH5_ACOCL|nr:hypothetical protein QJS10_CPA07g00968 [Acorus calamus]